MQHSMDERGLQPLDQVGIHWKWKLSTFLLLVHFKAMSTGGHPPTIQPYAMPFPREEHTPIQHN